MKKTYFLFAFLLISNFVFSQDSICDIGAGCSDTPLVFPNTVGVPNSETGPDYGCLGSQPNPAWYFLGFDEAGDIDIQISQVDSTGTPQDVDYICYGPFNDPFIACNNLSILNSANITTNNFGTQQCSYSTAAVENLDLDNVQIGDFYILLITNFSDIQGDITMTQTNVGEPNSGSTDCSYACSVSLENDVTLCLGDDYLLATTLGNASMGNSATYKWFKNGVEIVGETNNTYQIIGSTTTTTDTYSVEVDATLCDVLAIDDIVVDYVDVTANTVSDWLVCDDDGFYSFDLSTLETTILGTQNTADYEITFHHSQADADNDTNALVVPYTNTNKNVLKEIFIRIENINNTGCYDTSSFNIGAYQDPIANAVSLWTVFDDDGFYPFDLSTLNGTILGTQDAADFEITFHNSQADADNDTGALSIPYTNVAVNVLEEIFVRIENIGKTDCYDTTSFNIEVYDMPISNPVNDDIICDDDGFADFDLSALIATIIGNQNSAYINTTFHRSQADANSGANPISSPYTNANKNVDEQIFIRTENTTNTTLYDTISFFIGAYDTPTANDVDDWIVCDDDGFYPFDLSTLNGTILDIQDAAHFNITFHHSQSDADNNIGLISVPYTNATKNDTEQIYVRIENIGKTDCYDTTSLTIGAYDEPIADSVQDWFICDDDGFNTFDLSTLESDVLGAQDVNDFDISFHKTQSDATNNENTLNSSYTNAVENTTEEIFVRIENVYNTDCYTTNSFLIGAYYAPTLDVVDDWIACDDDIDGFYDFDLIEIIPNIIGNQNPDEYNFTFYHTQDDADNNIGALSIPYRNQIANTTEEIFVRVENILKTDCYSTSSFNINVARTPIANPIQDWIVCDDVDNDGFYNFDLTTRYADLLNGQDETEVTFSFYSTQVDADYKITPLNLNYINQGEFSEEEIFVRMENSTKEDCFNTTSFNINVIQNPIFDIIEDTKYICINLSSQMVEFEIENLQGTYDISWRDALGNELSNTNILQATQAGNYTVTATTTNGSLCSTTQTVYLLPAEPATAINFDMNEYWHEENFSIEVLVNGSGIYEYAIDDVNGPYQESNLLINVEPGVHTVYVKEIHNCGVTSREIDVFGFSSYFSPNGDGKHDIWKVQGISFKSTAKIHIFDRYGKLMHSFFPANYEGWNGFYNGNPAPEGEYWFTAEMTDYKGEPIIRKGHFSLIRTNN